MGVGGISQHTAAGTAGGGQDHVAARHDLRPVRWQRDAPRLPGGGSGRVPQLEVGAHTDVLDGCPKALGVIMLLRAANPQIIAVDEITAEEDLRAILTAANCGVALLATIHAADREELTRKQLFTKLLEMQVFRRLVTITVEPGRRVYRTELL